MKKYRLVNVELEQEQLRQQQEQQRQQNSFLTPTQVREEPKKAPSNLDLAIQRILDDDTLSDGLKGKLYVEALARYKNHESVERKTFPESEVLDLMPRDLRHKAKRILREIALNPNADIDSEGRFVYKGSPIPNSNIVDLVDDVLRSKRVSIPVGWREFADSLRKLDSDYIINPETWKVISPPKKRKKKASKAAPLWDDEL